MKQRRHSLITIVFIMGVVIAILSYLFHPDVGVFRLIVNGQPVDDAIIRFAAIPGALVIMLISSILAVLLFFGVSIIIFFVALFFAMLGVFLIAPFFWPVLVIIFLMIALLSVSGSR